MDFHADGVNAVARRLLVVLGASLLACTLLVAAFAGVSAPASSPTAGNVERRITPVLQSLHWEYRGIEGPPSWGYDYLLCENGQDQSPVNIEAGNVEEVEMEPLRWVYEREQISLHQREESYNSHKFDVKGMVRPHMELEGGGGVYTLQTIDVHSPSENAVDGVKFDVEVQFWHMAPGPKYMVVSAMFRKNVEKGSRSPPVFINEISRLLQKSVFKYNKLEPAVNFQSVIKSLSALSLNETNVATRQIDNFFRLNGSFPEPPCTEGVVWNVIREPLDIFFYDADEIQQDLAPNNRPLQPLGNRIVQVMPQNAPAVAEEQAERAQHATELQLLREVKVMRVKERDEKRLLEAVEAGKRLGRAQERSREREAERKGEKGMMMESQEQKDTKRGGAGTEVVRREREGTRQIAKGQTGEQYTSQQLDKGQERARKDDLVDVSESVGMRTAQTPRSGDVKEERGKVDRRRHASEQGRDEKMLRDAFADVASSVSRAARTSQHEETPTSTRESRIAMSQAQAGSVQQDDEQRLQPGGLRALFEQVLESGGAARQHQAHHAQTQRMPVAQAFVVSPGADAAPSSKVSPGLGPASQLQEAESQEAKIIADIEARNIVHSIADKPGTAGRT